MRDIKNFLHAPTIPYDSTVFDYMLAPWLNPFEFNGWIPETLSWKNSCYLGAGLSGGMSGTVVKGPDVVKLINEHSVNNVTNMKINTGRHIIMCSKNGNIIVHGVALRISENEFVFYGVSPYINFLSVSNGYNVEPAFSDPNDFLYQVAGPTSLQTLEQAAQEDLHDIKFMQFRNATIAGHKVRILRMGMGGTLAYEVHGNADDSHDVYKSIYDAGKAFGIERLGYRSYMCDHTENGFPQLGMHFVGAWKEHPEFVDWVKNNGYDSYWNPVRAIPKGSLSDNIDDYFRNPIELNWEKLVKFDHEFLGKDALQKIAEGTHRKTVTLRWNPDDVLDVYASLFRKDEEKYKLMEIPLNLKESLMGVLQDRVIDKNGHVVGISSGRVYTYYYGEVISQCVIDPGYSEIGSEVTVIWGDLNGKQKPIRATVERYPYLDLTPNQEFDVNTIPTFRK